MLTVEELKRFESKVDWIPTETGCLLWTASLGAQGYGQMKVGTRVLKAHRLAWERVHGEIPEGFCVLHDCPGGDNPACCNVEHLWLGTQAENMEDMRVKGRGPRGESNGGTKLTEAQVLEIRCLYATNKHTQPELGLKFGVGKSQICQIVNKRRWKHLASLPAN